ncbi:InlB B-repeat-containing protein [Geobacter sp. DSM 9736]|uniref:InlB B-repeat-containing protein n=1 Tax=Geobacter sp. DSM 9736 TaxID=1277350 RepID=UPI000B50EE6B|nr:InlB B-repeat-containing protein [Geobacter sp. DSM 9736]SNB46804.1 repeat domain (List_Bact_rpt) [Geobacter sp. DSM 9736]
MKVFGWRLLFLTVFLLSTYNLHAVAADYSIKIDSGAHNRYGLHYPATYKFKIPSAVRGLIAEYRYSLDDQWNRLPQRSKGDMFNGIDAVRFDYENGFAYASVRFSSRSDVIYLRILDGNGLPVNYTFDSIPLFYDDRRAAVTITLDDYADWTHGDFATALQYLEGYGLHFTLGVMSGQVYSWRQLQDLVDRHGAYLEVASHSSHHPRNAGGYAANGYEAEVIGSRDEIRNGLSFNGHPYIPLYIEPYGYSDSTLESYVSSGGYLVSRGVFSGTAFSAWNPEEGRYDRAPLTYHDYGRANDAQFVLEANAHFDQAVSQGGIYHLMDHPWQGMWQAGTPFLQHLDYIHGRSDIWYVPFGRLYQYHFLQERRGGLTISPADTNEDPSGHSHFTINTDSIGNGSITCTPGTTVDPGTAASCWVAADYGHHITDVTVDGTSQPVASRSTFSYSFDPVMRNHGISASFSPNSYSITFVSGGNGSVTGAASQLIGHGASTTAVTAVPAEGFRFVNWTAPDGFISTDNPLVLTNVAARRTVTANFDASSYFVEFLSSGNGTVSGNTGQTVTRGGATTAVTAIPAQGYHFEAWTSADGLVEKSNPLVLSFVTGNRTLTALFAPDTHTVTTESRGGGRIEPTGPVTIRHDSSTSFTVTPADSFRIASVTGCGGSLSGNTYTTGPITSDCSVSATFAEITHTLTGTVEAGKGTIACATPVTSGQSSSCTVTPAPGFMLVRLTDNGMDRTSEVQDNIYLLPSVTSAHAIAAEFAGDAYTLADAVTAQQQILGRRKVAEKELLRLDVAPLGPDGAPRPDGTVDVADVVIMLRRLVGIITW